MADERDTETVRTCYFTEADAYDALADLRQNWGVRAEGATIYKCRCGTWHIRWEAPKKAVEKAQGGARVGKRSA